MKNIYNNGNNDKERLRREKNKLAKAEKQHQEALKELNIMRDIERSLTLLTEDYHAGRFVPKSSK
jgi:hypothetical protein